MQDPKEKKPCVELTDSWEKDQAEHGYYYDDAHGYEQFNPESDEDSEDNEDPNKHTD